MNNRLVRDKNSAESRLSRYNSLSGFKCDKLTYPDTMLDIGSVPDNALHPTRFPLGTNRVEASHKSLC